jgi:hypothetical protein
MSDTYDSCSVCDRRIDPWGRDGVRCARCNEPCGVCGKDKAYCHHSLDATPRSELRRSGTGGWQ